MTQALRLMAGLVWRFIVALSFVVAAVAAMDRHVDFTSFVAAFVDVVDIIRDVTSGVWSFLPGPVFREVCAIEDLPETPIFDALGLLALLSISVIAGISKMVRSEARRTPDTILADFIGALGLVAIAVTLPLTIMVLRDVRLDDVVGELGQSPIAPIMLVTFAFFVVYARGEGWFEIFGIAVLRLIIAILVLFLFMTGMISFFPILLSAIDLGVNQSGQNIPEPCGFLHFADRYKIPTSASGPALLSQLELHFIAKVFGPTFAFLAMVELRFGRPGTLGRRFADTIVVSAIVVIVAFVRNLAGWTG